MNPILHLVYRFLQALAIVSLRVYFRKIVYLNRQHLTTKGPLVVVCNHPNTVVDPLLSVMYVREPCFLLANYGLFKNPIAGAILRTLYCIPVKRTQDVAEGEERNNDDAFQESRAHLTAGRSLFVAPEGSSYTERHVREFKTGAARIILEAESQANFSLNVQVLPLGLTYTDPLKFGSDVMVEVGEPFSAKNWQALYAENPRQAAEEFTQYIENQFHTLSIHCEDVHEDHFLQKLEAIIQSEKPLDTEGSYFRSKQILTYLQDWKRTDPVEFDIFRNDIETYFLRLNELKVKNVNLRTFPALSTFFKFLLGIPFLIIGLIPNFIPAWFSHNLVKWLNLDSAYDTTVRLLSGIFIFFPIFWWLQTELFFAFFFPEIDNLGFFQTILLVIGYILSGMLAWRVYTEGSSFFNFLKFKRVDADGSLSKLRQSVSDRLYFFWK
jgi:glycerol-3-phosphate O-acyltransferase / dihydroxyacetone phosphate acyltransferase